MEFVEIILDKIREILEIFFKQTLDMCIMHFLIIGMTTVKR